MNSVGEKKHPKEEIKQIDFSFKAPGKLTAPTKTDRLASSMD